MYVYENFFYFVLYCDLNEIRDGIGARLHHGSL